MNRQTDENFFNWNYQENIFFFLKFPPPLFVPHFKVDIQLPSSLKEGLTQHEYETEILLHMKGDKGKKKKQMCCTTPAICTAGIRLKQSSKFSCITFSN